MRVEWSVVVPANRYRRTLKRCLDSSRKQLGEGDQLLVYDTSGDPRVAATAYGCGAGVAHGPIASMVENWNAAVSLARGDVVHLLHDDDYVLPGFYEALGVLGDCGGATCGYVNEDEDGRPIYSHQLTGRRERASSLDFLRSVVCGNFVNPVSVVFHREVYGVGLYRPDIEDCADWEFLCRAAAKYDFWLDGRFLARRRIDLGNAANTAHLAKVFATIRRVVPEVVALLPEDERAVALVRSRENYRLWCLNSAVRLGMQGRWEAADAVFREAVEWCR